MISHQNIDIDTVVWSYSGFSTLSCIFLLTWCVCFVYIILKQITNIVELLPEFYSYIALQNKESFWNKFHNILMP